MTSTPDNVTTAVDDLTAAMADYTMPAGEASAALDGLIAAAESAPPAGPGPVGETISFATAGDVGPQSPSLSARGIAASEPAQDLRGLVEGLEPPAA